MKLNLVLLSAAFASTPALALDLVTNGNFQIGSLAGWTLDAGDATVSSSAANYFALLGAAGANDYSFQLTQVMAAAAVPVVSTLSFDWGAAASANVQSMRVWVSTASGVVVNTVINAAPSQAGTFSHYSFPFLSNASLIQITFSNATTGARVSQMLDNVSVVPEPATLLLWLLGVPLLLAPALRAAGAAAGAPSRR